MRFVRSGARDEHRRESHQAPSLDRNLQELSILRLDFESALQSETRQDVRAVRIAGQVRSMLRSYELGLALNSAEAASRLAMSERGLVRTLASEGTSFRAVRD